MDREYDIFEKFSDGSVQWRGFVPGLENAIVKLKELAGLSPNEYFAMHTPTKEVVARVNAAKDDTPTSA